MPKQGYSSEITTIPEKGQYPAFRMEDGTVIVDRYPVGRTHFMFTKENKIPLHEIKSAGIVVDGVYDDDRRSTMGPLIEQAKAKERLRRKKDEKRAESTAEKEEDREEIF